jgi:hypothetical protein
MREASIRRCRSSQPRFRRSGRAFPVSRRATEGVFEYFSETFSACRFEDSLPDKDPEGYDMIEDNVEVVVEKVDHNALSRIGNELTDL